MVSERTKNWKMGFRAPAAPTEPNVRIVGIEVRRVAAMAIGVVLHWPSDEVAGNLPSVSFILLTFVVTIPKAPPSDPDGRISRVRPPWASIRDASLPAFPNGSWLKW